MLPGDEWHRAGKLEKPSGVTGGDDRPEHTGGHAGGGAGEVDRGHAQAMGFYAPGGGGEVAGCDGRDSK